MLEKIGLPPRPSMPGGNWVPNASHCQGCQSQFTIFNRKHHCRRCGGLFCNNCTQQRIILRGQGDSPVRICESCKKIEEAARIELRLGHRTRKAKANSKKSAKNEEEILQEFIKGEKFPILAVSVETDLQEARSSMASSSMQEVPQSPDRIEDIIRIASSDPHNNVMNEVGSSSPEELRRLAQEEKNKHRILKSQGKPDEALAAFKHGKEMERQAASLEITLRKNRRLASMQKTSKRTDDGELLTDKKQIPSRTSESKKDDLANELKELGWSDADAHEAERKPEKQSIESELSSLFRGSHTEKKVSSIDKSQVIAHKKRALELKREGKLAEAKEELKQAKILEKQLEEQEFLAEGDESDDEIAALIRSMGDDKQDDLSFDDIPGQDMNFNFANLGDDFSLEPKFDVNDDDLNDPEMAATLKSFGWSEEDAHLEEDVPEAYSEVDHKKLADEVLALKREAVKHKKAGNLPVAMELLKKANILEKELESLQSYTPPVQKTLETPSPGEQLLPTNSNVSAAAALPSDHKQPPKSKAVIQRELLALKRKALALKRGGHAEEAEEELRRGKVLELQLEEMEKVPKPLNAKELDKKNILATHPHEGAIMTADLAVVDNTDVTDQDMEDPALLLVLKNLGWEDNPEAVDGATEMLVTTSGQSKARIDHLLSLKPTKSKSEIQKELLAIKRRALAFRRQGKVEEADEELRKTADLENQLKDLEAKHQTEQFAERDNSSILSVRSESLRSTGDILKDEHEVKHQHDHFKKSNDEIGSSTRPDTSGREISNDQKEYIHHVNLVVTPSVQVKDQNNHDYTTEIPRGGGDQQTSDSINFKESSKGSNSSQVNDEKNYGVRFLAPGKVVSRGEIQKELLAIKRKALVLRRQGKLAEADEELAKAKDLEDQLDAIDKIEKEHGRLPHVQKEEKVVDVLSVLMNVDSMHKDVAADSARYPEGNHEVKPPFASFSMKNGSSDGRHDAVIVPPPREPVNLIDLLTGSNQTKISSESVAVVSLPINSDMLDLLSSDDWNNQPFLPNNLDQDARPFYLTLDDPSLLEVAVDSKTSDHLPDQGPTLKNDNKALHGLPNLVSQNEVNEASPVKGMETSATKSNTPHEPGSLKDQILSHKRRALMLKREGKLAEAREELKQAKLLERTVEGDVKQTNEDNQRVITSVSADVPVTRKSEKESVPVSQKSIQETNVPSQKPMSGRDRFKLQQECLSKKRQAAKLRREGKMDEAESLLEHAKNLQAQIEEIDSMNPNASGKQVEDDALVEDLLDPQLLSALQSIGIGVEKNVSQPPKRTEVKPSASKTDSKLIAGNMEVNTTVSDAGTERVQLEEQIKAEKVRALNFKRAGKQAEAMEALRSAKRLEKKLASLG